MRKKGNLMNYDPADLPVILLYNLDRSWPPADIQEVQNLTQTLAAGLIAVGHPVQTICLEDDNLERAMSGCDPTRQIVFNWCEEVPGIPHSGCWVARKLEELGFIFTGAGSRALAFSHDKPAVKACFNKQAIPTPYWQVYESADSLDWEVYPAIVKPAHEHCSFGITHEAVVHTHQELANRIMNVIETFHQPVLVEDFIDGREFHVSVVGNGRLRVLPIAEMDFSAIREDNGRLCTYDSKFAPASSDYQMIQLNLPAVLSIIEKLKLEEIAIAAYRVASCRDYARLDIRQRNGTFYVLDVNPNADISPDTSVALSAELAGYSFGQFGSLLIKLAAHRHPLLGRKEIKTARQALPAIVPVD
jgi:D-alanine-D-alanine ligase